MGTLRNLWLRWKMLKLPWRKQLLIGQDLQGNTFWEFRDIRHSNSSSSSGPSKRRRIIRTPRKTYLSDVQISPQWHQWLRHTRQDAPTVDEQLADVSRLRDIKGLAQLADQRWAEKKRYIDAPITKKEPQTRNTEGGEMGSASGSAAEDEGRTPGGNAAKKQTQDPWAKAEEIEKARRDMGGGKWRPDAWVPGPNKR